MIANLGVSVVALSDRCSFDGRSSSANSTYAKNLHTILLSLPSNITSNNGFYNATSGQDPDKVYALGLCRGDLSSAACYDCTSSAVQLINMQCKEEISWAESGCLIRYANRNFFSRMETSPSKCVSNPNRVSENDAQSFNDTLNNLMEKLTSQASSGSSSSSTLYFATGNSGKVYGLVQCSQDISQDDCSNCLQGAMDEMVGCSNGTEGGRIFRPSCMVWFENFKFYDSPGISVSLPLSPPTTASSPPGPADFSPPPKTITKDVVKLLESMRYDLNTIKAATNNFSDANKLGHEGFGSVYQAWKNWRNGTAATLIDNTLRTTSVIDTIMRCIHIGLLCVQENATYRPTMASVVVMLNSSFPTLEQPSQPAFFMHGNTDAREPRSLGTTSEQSREYIRARSH